MDAEWSAKGETARGAVNKIRQCLHAKEEAIDLSHFNLSEWPHYLLPTLRKIDASHNAFQQFPPASLVKIESLDLIHNHLTQLPAVYSAPLSRLNISHNALSSLPAPLYESLEHLRVNNNQLNYLDNLSSASLKWLEARNCGLQHFSATTPALTHLDLSENHITSPQKPTLYRYQPQSTAPACSILKRRYCRFSKLTII